MLCTRTAAVWINTEQIDVFTTTELSVLLSLAGDAAAAWVRCSLLPRATGELSLHNKHVYGSTHIFVLFSVSHRVALGWFRSIPTPVGQWLSLFMATRPIYFQSHFLNFSVIIILKKIVDTKNSVTAVSSLCVFICAGNTSEGNFYRLMKYSVVFHRYNRPKIVIEAMVMGYNGDCSDMLYRHSITKHVLYNLYSTERMNKCIWLLSYNVITHKD